MHKYYSLLGLCKKAGKLAGGEAAVEEAVRGKTALLLIIAEDASKNTKKKFYNSARYYQIPIVQYGTKEQLGKAVGEQIRAIFAVTEAGFAKKLEQIATQLHETKIESI